METALVYEQIHRKRIELCYPHSGQPPSDDDIVRQLSDIVLRLPRDLQLNILEFADPVSFAILQSVIRPPQALYCNQLSKILHQSRFAPALQGSPTEAHETYERVLMARKYIFDSIRRGIFPLRPRSEIVKWRFAEDYRLMYTLEVYGNQITVWKVCGDTVTFVWSRDGIFDAVFSPRGNNVLVSCSNGVLEVRHFADSHELVMSVQLGEFNRLFTSDTYLFAAGMGGPTLWKWESSSSLARI